MTEAELQLSRRAAKALERFEEAVREHAFKGTKPPGAHEYIEREYELAKEQLVEVILDGEQNG